MIMRLMHKFEEILAMVQPVPSLLFFFIFALCSATASPLVHVKSVFVPFVSLFNLYLCQL